MIRYALKCDAEHSFESWFQSASAFETLFDGGMVSCAVCGSGKVQKAIMTPGASGTKKSQKAVEPMQSYAGVLSKPASPAEQALTELRKKIVANSEDVGTEFAREARAIHEGEAPERPIIGEARANEARALIEDGIPVAPLPWQSRKSN